MRSAKHHYVPKGILKRFRAHDGKIYYYTRRTGKIEPRNAESIFCRRHWHSYATSAGNYDDRLEIEYFQKLDDDASVMMDEIEAIINRGRVPRLSVLQSDFVRRFIYALWRRSPEQIEAIDSYKNSASSVADYLARYESENGSIDDARREELLGAPFVEKLRNHTRVHVLGRESPSVMEVLSQKRVYFAVAPESKSFVICSKPVYKIAEGKPRAWRDVEFWAPLSKNVSVVLSSGDYEPLNLLNREHVRRINLIGAAQSVAFAGASRELVISVANAVGDPVNVFRSAAE